MSIYGTPINESPVVVIKASESIAAPAFLAVTADGKVATAGANAIGIVTPSSDSAVASGDDLNVQVKDIGTWIAGGTFSAGAELTSDANGKAVAATAGKFITAIALEAATASGQCISVQICKCGYKSSSDAPSVALSDLTDVDFTTPATNGQVLKYNGAKWAPAADATE